MDRKKELKKMYRENPPESGIFKITNLKNGKIFIGRAVNLKGTMNGQRVRLEGGKHLNYELQKDWTLMGDKSFSIEILDILELKPDSEIDSELEELEKLWLEKLQPFDHAGCNFRKTN